MSGVEWGAMVSGVAMLGLVYAWIVTTVYRDTMAYRRNRAALLEPEVAVERAGSGD